MATNRLSGFSLIELLIAMAILGIFLVLGGLGLNRTIQTARLNEASQTLSENLKLIGQEALTSSQEITVSIDSQGISWLTEAGVSRSLSLPHNALLSSSKSSFTFSGRGFPIEGSVGFVVKRNEKTRALSLLATGMVIYP